jgi:hypothetical protein
VLGTSLRCLLIGGRSTCVYTMLENAGFGESQTQPTNKSKRSEFHAAADVIDEQALGELPRK